MASNQDCNSPMSFLVTRSRWKALSSDPRGRALGKSANRVMISRKLDSLVGAGSKASSNADVTSASSCWVSLHPVGVGSTVTLTSKGGSVSLLLWKSRGETKRTHRLRYSKILV